MPAVVRHGNRSAVRYLAHATVLTLTLHQLTLLAAVGLPHLTKNSDPVLWLNGANAMSQATPVTTLSGVNPEKKLKAGSALIALANCTK